MKLAHLKAFRKDCLEGLIKVVNNYKYLYILLGVQSIIHLNAQIKLCLKKYLCSFSDSGGLSYDQTTP